MIEFLVENWEYILLAFYVLEKIVKKSKSRYDDILLDIVWSGLKKLVKK